MALKPNQGCRSDPLVKMSVKGFSLSRLQRKQDTGFQHILLPSSKKNCYFEGRQQDAFTKNAIIPAGGLNKAIGMCRLAPRSCLCISP